MIATYLLFAALLASLVGLFWLSGHPKGGRCGPAHKARCWTVPIWPIWPCCEMADVRAGTDCEAAEGDSA